MAIKGMFGNQEDFGRRIRDMKVGEVAYVEPLALVFDTRKTPYLNLAFPLSEETNNSFFDGENYIRDFIAQKGYINVHGNFMPHRQDNLMEIKRIGPLNTDYEIDIKKVDYNWNLFDDVSFYYSPENLVKLTYDLRDPKKKTTGITLDKFFTDLAKGKTLEKQLKLAVAEEKFEKAAELRDKIKARKNKTKPKK